VSEYLDAGGTAADLARRITEEMKRSGLTGSVLPKEDTSNEEVGI
jgi:hypothetical protein